MTKRAANTPRPRGGAQPGAGRPTKFPGKTVKRTIKITEDAKALVISAQADLMKADGAERTFSYTVEYLVRKATKTR